MQALSTVCQTATGLLLGAAAVHAAADLDLTRALADHTRALSSVESRVTGYPGARQALATIAARLTAAGVTERYRRELSVPVPIDRGASLTTAAGDTLGLHSMWPNLARTPTTAGDGLRGRLAYAGRGRLVDLRGVDLRGAIALLEYDSRDAWVRLFDQGATAVVFLAGEAALAPTWAHRSEGSAKFLSTPADLPRYYAPRPVARRLRQLAASGATGRIEARMDWQAVAVQTLVAVVPGVDPALAGDGLVVGAYYDAISPVPGVAPGADQAGGVVTWLELAARLAAHPPRRTAVLVAVPGHFEALAGMRDFVGLLRQLAGGEPPATLLQTRLAGLHIGTVMCLDLSSRGRGVALEQAGTPYRVRTARPALFDGVEAFAAGYEARLGRRILGGGLRPLADRRLLGRLAEPIPADGAVASLAGFLGLTLVTSGDTRPLFDSPEDVVRWVDVQGLARQAEFAIALVRHLLDEADADLTPERAKDSYGTLTGRFVTWGRGGFEPDEPIAAALVRVRSLHHTLAGVRPDPMALTEADGSFRLQGVEARTLYLKPVELEAYGVETASGRVTAAIDRGPFGAVSYPSRVLMDHNEEERTLLGFGVRSLVLTDLFDPRTLSTLDHPRLLDGAADADLERFGYSLPYTTGQIEENGYWDGAGPRKGRVGVLFAPPGRSVKVTMTSGRLGVGQRLVLLQGRAAHPLGTGYGGSQSEVLWGTAARVATDLAHLNQHRLAELESHGIHSRQLHTLVDRGRQLAATAASARDRGDAASQLAAGREAWSLGILAHEAIADVGADAVSGVLFVLLAMLPFCVFAERLVLEAATVRGQVAGTVAAFVVAFAVLRQAHPAFDLTLYPMVVLIGFLILALSAAVTAIGLGRLNVQLRESVSAVVARHRADPRRTAMAGRAFLIGVAQMRRRPLRTGLTCATLALLTFSLVSFTSVRSTQRLQLTAASGVASGGDAVEVRLPAWDGLEEAVIEHFEVLLGDAVPRVWYLQEGLMYHGDRQVRVQAALGLDAAEARITPVTEALRAGRWLSGGRHECLLPEALAEALEIAPAAVGVARVTYLGESYVVVGIVDSRTWDGLVDVTGGRMTPLDLDAYQPEERRAGVDRRGEAPAFAHLPARQVLFLPAAVVAGFGRHARLASVAAPLTGGREQLEGLAHGLDVNLFARLDGHPWVVDTARDHDLSGERGVWVPLLIAALIVFNTMLGSVYERTGEIAILNAVGLAPGHVAGLFVAEAAAFATLGGMTGYLAAQVTSKVGLVAGLFPGLTVNHSSYSAVATLAMVMGVVVLSALYPARAAGRMCVPGIERSWQLPAAQGDRLRLEMPFSLRRREAFGLVRFVAEYLGSYDERSIGATFYAEDVTEEDGAVAGLVWLAPFDGGVSQRVRVDAVIDETSYASLVLTLDRRTGDDGTWRRANRHFVDGLRRQFLMWRALTDSERELYAGAVA